MEKGSKRQRGTLLRPRLRAFKSGLICFFFHPEQCFSLTNSSSIPPNHPNSFRIPPSEQALSALAKGR